MKGQTLILSNPNVRRRAHQLIECAPDRAVLNIREAGRTNDQNAKMWAMLSDIARAKPQGRVLTTENWKALFMNAAGFSCTFEPALDGRGVVPLGFKSSRLNKAEFSDLIEAIYAFGAEHGVEWTDPVERKAA
ncbi:recombination protein NinB [Novosphingobium sp. MBES04]|uniref:recombination protein NinB n=1 Tax=Novosphingobium sp. MBES04 TaxID=1206458 RepID=UPI00057F5463|nr:recombination protein NinB [Novosphingobium sp. MBES04]GAM06361.1 NinB protein [Novosphingobium sp. MBES04]